MRTKPPTRMRSMLCRPLLPAVAIAILVCCHAETLAGGFGGRGGGGRGNLGGGRASFGGARPNLGSARPSVGARPSVAARPNFGSVPPSVGGGRLPTQRPQTSLPHFGGSPDFGRPNVSRPSVSRPSLSRPNVDRPEAARPGISRPTPSQPSSRPGRPNVNLPGRGDLGSRPTTLPGRVPGGSRPGGSERPNLPDFGRLPEGRPSGGQLGNFLGLDRPLTPSRPNRPSTLPGDLNAERPNRPQRPTTLPGVQGRPGLANRPRPNDRLPIDRRPSINIGDINLGNNTVISNRPSWVNIDNNRLTAIDRRWQNRIGNATTLPALLPDRLDHFHDWGDQVRDRWYGNRYPGYFRPNWWANHRFHCSGWHYFYAYSYYPYTYWWSTPTYVDVTGWFNWNAPPISSQTPVYYDYGSGGNVTYQDNRVSIGGEPIASAEEFAESAAALATVSEPKTQEAAEQAEWLPLGTFALTTDPDDVDPNRIVQLAVNKDGIVSGTLYNKVTDQTQAIQGRVDKETQRVALRIGESEDVIAETGLYNLTQDEASVLVHFGVETQDTYLLVRLPSPEEPVSEQ